MTAEKRTDTKNYSYFYYYDESVVGRKFHTRPTFYKEDFIEFLAVRFKNLQDNKK